MKTENQNQNSGHFLGGTLNARTWTLAISGLQTIFGFLVLGMSLKSFRVSLNSKALQNFKHEEINPVLESMRLAGLIVQLISCLFAIITGTVLFIGVIKKNARIVGAFLILQVFLLVFAYIGFVYVTKRGDFTIGVIDLVVNILGIFSIYVVNVHREELEMEACAGV